MLSHRNDFASFINRHHTRRLADAELKRFPYQIPIQRKSDLLRLRVSDVDAEERLISLVTRYHWKPKASAGSIPISPNLRKLLEPLAKEATSNFVFPNKDGGAWKIDVRNELIKIARGAGINDFTRVHDLRHTTGATLRANGAPLETIMGVLRHADIKETLIYAPYEESEGQSAIKKIDFF